jgi:signal transduction histidine kinase
MSMFLFADITEVRRKEKSKLESKYKNIFLSSVSHNLKTPLNSMYFFNFYLCVLGIHINTEILLKRLKYTDELSY